MVLDSRQIIGSKVHAKALHVTNNAECSRQYGAGKKTKLLSGTVVEAKEVQKEGNSWVSWFITADYNLGGGDMKRAELNTRSVKKGEIPSVLPEALPAQPTLPIPPPDPPICSPIAVAPPIQPAQGDQVNNDPSEINEREELLPQEPQNVPPLPPPPPPVHQPTTTAHTMAWYKDLEACQMSMGGNVAF
jgi:hypothetical protein